MTTTGGAATGGKVPIKDMEDPQAVAVLLSPAEVMCTRPGCRWFVLSFGDTTDEQLAAYLRHRQQGCPL